MAQDGEPPHAATQSARLVAAPPSINRNSNRIRIQELRRKDHVVMQKHFEEEKKDVGTVALDTSSSTHIFRIQKTG